MLFSVGCESDPPGDTGLGVLPDEDIIGLVYTDTTSIEIETRWLDRVTTGNTNIQMLGNYSDPEFGRLSATTYTQALLPGVDIDFGGRDNVLFESISLHMDMLNAYGDYEFPLTMRVYELADSISSIDSSLTSDLPPMATKGPELSNGFVIDYSGEIELKDLVVPLRDELGERILYADSADLENNDVFKNFFKGLAIGTEDVRYTTREPGAIFQVFLNSNDSFIRLKYWTKDSSENFTVLDSLDLLITDEANKYHTIYRTQFDNVLLGQVAGNPSPGPKMYEFMQAGGFIKIFVKLPHLNAMPQVGVNRSELVMKVDDQFFGSSNRFSPPLRIRMFLADENGVEDRTSSGGYFINTEADYDLDEKEYRFQITGYTQEVISRRRENYGFVLAPSDTAVSMNRVIFGGLDNPNLRPVVNLTFTTLPR